MKNRSRPTAPQDPATLLRPAERHLGKADPVLARLIAKYRPCTLGGLQRDPLRVLCAAIISQQLSSKAAETIQKRVELVLGTKGRIAAPHLLSVTQEQLRTCGLSNAKAKSLRALAQIVDSGEFSFSRLRRMDDEAAIEALDALPGIGRWTAEMFLIFAMHRLDIYSMGDVGLRRAVDRLYGSGRRLSDRKTLSITGRWTPYRSVASWYLWKLTDGDV